MTDTPLTGSDRDDFARAVQLFNEREYFACHDVLEDLWGIAVESQRDFFQGLLHAAVCLFHYSEGNPAGARKMAGSTREYLSGYGEQHAGVDLGKLRADLAGCLAPLWVPGAVQPGDLPDLDAFPRLMWNPDDE